MQIPVEAARIPLVQPGQPMWVQRPAPVPGCIPGLEYLLYVDSLFMNQIPSLLEAFTGWDTNNKYVVYNSSGQQVYYAMEKSTTCMRMCCGAQRGFTIHIVDNTNQEVFRIVRDFKCCAGCGWCAGCCDGCAHEIMVTTPQGAILGYIKQKGSFFRAKFHVLDSDHKPVLNIEGPKCILDGPCCPTDNDFKIMSLNNEVEVGKLKKHYSGFMREMYSNADKFSVSFPIDMSVATKATLLGALFLIDFMFFEMKKSNN